MTGAPAAVNACTRKCACITNDMDVYGVFVLRYERS